MVRIALPLRIDDSSVEELKKLSRIDPFSLMGIKESLRRFPSKEQYAV